MDDHLRSKTIAANPIGKGLDTFRATFGRLCESKDISPSPESLHHLNLADALAVKRDSDIWRQAYGAVAEYTPPRQTTASSLQQTPWLQNTSSFVNSSEHRKYVDGVLKEELGSLYIGLPDLQNVFFRGVTDLEMQSGKRTQMRWRVDKNPSRAGQTAGS
ncbi:hypothetical protein PG987_001825 [Apiospora arundinis]